MEKCLIIVDFYCKYIYNPCAKLNEELVKQLRQDLNQKLYTKKELCYKYNISKSAIYLIQKNLMWKEI